MARYQSSPYASIIEEATRCANIPGIDCDKLFAFMMIESGGRVGAKGSGSSAEGLMQIIDGTYNSLYSRYGARFNLTNNKYDPRTSLILGAMYAVDNTKALRGAGVTRPIDERDLYAMHFLGGGDGPKFLKMLQVSPNEIAASHFPGPANAKGNHSIFYNSNGTAKTVEEVYEEMGRRLAKALGETHQQRYGSDGNRQSGTYNAGDLGSVDVRYEETAPALKDDGHDLGQFDGYAAKGLASTGNRVKDMQRQLHKLGYNLGNYGSADPETGERVGDDGMFGPKTLAGIRKFQKDHNLKVTGKLDPETEKALDDAAPLEAKNPRPVLKDGESKFVDPASANSNKQIAITDEQKKVLIELFGKEGAEALFKNISAGTIGADDPVTAKVSAARRDFVAEARQYVGQSWGDGNNSGVKIRQLGCDGQPWCAGFANWVMKDVLGDDAKGLKTFGSLDMGHRAEKMGVLIKDNNYIPKPGDIIVENRGGGEGHIAIVEKVEGNKIICIAGNLGANDKVGHQTYRLGDSKIDFIDFGAIVEKALDNPRSQTSARYKVQDTDSVSSQAAVYHNKARGAGAGVTTSA